MIIDQQNSNRTEIKSNSSNEKDKAHEIIHNMKNMLREQRLIFDEIVSDFKKGKKVDAKYIQDMNRTILQINDTWANNKQFLS